MRLGYLSVYIDSSGSKRTYFDLPRHIAEPFFNPVLIATEFTLGIVGRVFRRLRVVCREKFRVAPKPTGNPETNTKEKSSGSRERKRAVILPYEVTRMISRHLHHTDLVSASQSSRRLRITLLGPGDASIGLNALRESACESPKSSCRVCGYQICDVSDRPPPPPSSLFNTTVD